VFALGALDRPVRDTAKRLEAVAALRGSADFEALSSAFKRVRNILADKNPGQVDPEAFAEKEEEELYSALVAVEPSTTAKIENGAYKEALLELSTLRPKVDRFFDEVLVMAEDETLRANRLALLHRLRTLLSRVADLSEIVPADA